MRAIVVILLLLAAAAASHAIPRFVTVPVPSSIGGFSLSADGAAVFWDKPSSDPGPAWSVLLGYAGRDARAFRGVPGAEARLRELEVHPATFRVRVVRDGYEPAEIDVPAALFAGESELPVHLTPRIAEVTFQTVPPGAAVHLGAPEGAVIGRSGEQTSVPMPLLVDDTGHFADTWLFFELDGYERSRAVRLEPAKLLATRLWPSPPVVLVASRQPVPSLAWLALLAVGVGGGLWLWRRRPAAPPAGAAHDPTPSARAAGPWVIGERLGQGGSSSVFRARHADSGVQAALKVLDDDAAGELAERRRFAREVEIWRGLSHPHIARVIEWDAQATPPWLAMECVEGPSLRAILNQGALPTPDFRRIFGALLSAVAYAHGRGVVHRDLKPENVLLTAEGDVKVVDFGLARGTLFDQVTTTGRAVGTLAYMSPERFVAAVSDDPAADQYALGVVAYEMLAGRRPYANHEVPEVMLGMSSREADDLCTLRADVPRAVEAVLSRMRALQMEARYATVQAAQEACEAAWEA